MNKATLLKIGTICAASITGVIDILTTKDVFALEANPIILIGGDLLSMILLKFAVIALLAWQFWRIDKYPRATQFLLCSGMTILIMTQVLAASNNMGVKEQLGGTVPKGPKTMAEKLDHAQSYMIFALIFVYYPMLVSLVSFALYDTITRRKPE